MRFLAFAALLGGGLLTGFTASAQHGPRRHYSHQGRPFYRGPLRLTLGGGVAAYNGDLGGVSESFIGPAATLGVLYRLQPHLLIGSEFGYFQMGSRDRLAERGVAFTSSNGTLSTFLRFELLPDESAFVSSQSSTPAFQLYLQGGVGALLYNPKSYLGSARPTNGTVYLAPERNDYPAMALMAPLGGGLSVRINDRLRVGAEALYHFTTSDHLDDVSQRGNPAENDGFGTLQLKLDYAIFE